MKILCVFGKHNYGNPVRGISYEYANFIPAMKRLGHEVMFFESWDKAQYCDFADLNRKLLQTVQNQRPEVIFFVLITYEIWRETLILLREAGTAVLIHWATDDSWKYEKFSRFIAACFDFHVTTYPSAMIKAKRDGLENFVLSQWAANSANMKSPKRAVDCSRGVTFIGSAHGNRGKWIKSLKKRGVDVECFGFGWPAGSVAAEDIPAIIRDSRISLNFSESDFVVENLRICRDRQIKARVFEVTGAGGLLLTEWADNLNKFYRPGQEIMVFQAMDELCTAIKMVLADNALRDRVAIAGYEKTKALHTYEHRFQLLFSRAARLANERNNTNTIFADEINGRFSHAAEQHVPGNCLLLLRRIMILVFSLFCGRQRGARAARRLLFELSWRLNGRKCYSASGWPGRIFYHES